MIVKIYLYNFCSIEVWAYFGHDVDLFYVTPPPHNGFDPCIAEFECDLSNPNASKRNTRTLHLKLKT